jgi:hypothetical protein
MPLQSVRKTEAPLAAYDRLNPFPARILEIAPLTRKTRKRMCASCRSICAAALAYEVGDALGVYRRIAPTWWKPCSKPGSDWRRTCDDTGKLRCAGAHRLAKAYVITACSDEFLMTLARLAADPVESSRLAMCSKR